MDSGHICIEVESNLFFTYLKMTNQSAPLSSKDIVLLDITDSIAVITINRPHKRNALNKDVRSRLFEILKDVDSDHRIKASVITGAGESFAAGADIEAMKDYSAVDAEAASREGSRVFSFIGDMKCPVIAAVNGWALGGGCELAVSCDIRIASEDARFGQPEVMLGIMPGYGATVRLPRIIGDGMARELILTGRILNAHEAYQIGLVNRVVSKSALMDETLNLAGKISHASVAVSSAKKALNNAFDMDMHSALDLQSRLYGQLYNTHDAKEGLISYIKKRRPVFKGR